jgi:hypothetical protein
MSETNQTITGQKTVYQLNLLMFSGPALYGKPSGSVIVSVIDDLTVDDLQSLMSVFVGQWRERFLQAFISTEESPKRVRSGTSNMGYEIVEKYSMTIIKNEMPTDEINQ